MVLDSGFYLSGFQIAKVVGFQILFSSTAYLRISFPVNDLIGVFFFLQDFCKKRTRSRFFYRIAHFYAKKMILY